MYSSNIVRSFGRCPFFLLHDISSVEEYDPEHIHVHTMCLIAKFRYKIFLGIPIRAFSVFELALTFGLKFYNYRKRFFSWYCRSAILVFPHRCAYIREINSGKQRARGRIPPECELAIWVRCRQIPEFGNFAARDLLSSARKFAWSRRNALSLFLSNSLTHYYSK